MSTVDLRDAFRAKYGSKSATDVVMPAALERAVEPERAFVVHAQSGRTVITAPLREIAATNAEFTYLHGRFVEADTPNGNGALWTTEDLQLGERTVAGGPLNWLHQERKIVGALLDAQLVTPEREAAALDAFIDDLAGELGREIAKNFSADKRKSMAKSGSAMADGSYPIDDAESLKAAIRLVGRSAKYSVNAVRAFIIRRAKALGLTSLLPQGWTRESAALQAPSVGNHLVAAAAVWRFLFPNETRTIESAARDGGAFYSMECTSREVACIDGPGHPGCGDVFSYGDYDAGHCCAHLRERSSIRRFVDPLFLGGAIIVPPVRPGWANANVDVVRQAAELSERAHLDDELSKAQAQDLAAMVLTWANRED